ncbi:GNAT family N-acetyltransferase [Stakelama tenebrarum]|uniref:GNAT family N-acetyltransferase n=1 Tax=Stakelama tenebrarum TaxID=2711215 RepID=A0A6G6Y7Q1_9SPHN|nr:GNAT family N-acetyltransferase [Sphingosinithalassobacter tenebrarum]QIG80603.1 GNAT family N-acetyltransferase [Sphingosinithalassobacter tenebrarum]
MAQGGGFRLHEPEAPDARHREAVLAPLRAYNVARAGDGGFRPVAILLRDADNSDRGGLWGTIGYDWLFVELLVVPESARGQGIGARLMARAEAIARADGCVGIRLDTFEFQARGFYEKLGFELYGTIEDHPVGSRRYFLKKRIGGAADIPAG